jgi:hypothetical protein
VPPLLDAQASHAALAGAFPARQTA